MRSVKTQSPVGKDNVKDHPGEIKVNFRSLELKVWSVHEQRLGVG